MNCALQPERRPISILAVALPQVPNNRGNVP